MPFSISIRNGRDIMRNLSLVNCMSRPDPNASHTLRPVRYDSPTFFTFSPTDLLIIAGVFLGFALTLAARTWVKLNEPTLLASRRAADTFDALARTRAVGAEEARRTEIELSTGKAARS